MIIPESLPVITFIVITIGIFLFLFKKKDLSLWGKLGISAGASVLVIYCLSLFVKTLIVVENPIDANSTVQYKIIKAYGHPSLSLSNGVSFSTKDIDFKKDINYVFNFSDYDLVVYPIFYTDKEEDFDESELPESDYIEAGTYKRIGYLPDYWFTDSPDVISVSSSQLEHFAKKVTNGATTRIKWGILAYAYNPFSMTNELDYVLNDESATFSEIKEAAIPLSDRLLSLSEEETWEHRMYAQLIARSEMNCISDWLDLQTTEPPTEEVSIIMEPLLHTLGQWFYSTEDGRPSLWTDVFIYIDSDSGIESYDNYHLVVNMPTASDKEANLQIVYPEMAVGTPWLVFMNYLDSTLTEKDYDTANKVPMKKWNQANELEKGTPMTAMADQKIVDMMLSYDVMFIAVDRNESLEGEDNHIIVTSIPLKWFQKSFKEHLNR